MANTKTKQKPKTASKPRNEPEVERRPKTFAYQDAGDRIHRMDIQGEPHVPATTTGGGHMPPSAALKSPGGRGLSGKVEDNLIPIIYILQPLSPQCLDGDERRMDDAEPGMIWLRNSPDPLVSGEEGIFFQPVEFYTEWQRWIPRKRGGGFLGRSPTRWPEATQKKDPENPRRVRYVMTGDGGDDEIVEARVFIGNVYRGDKPPEGYMISLSSTGHTVGRQLMTMMNQKRLPNGAKPDAWACLYHLTTKMRKNAQGSWFILEPHDVVEDGEFAGWASDDQFRYGETLWSAFQSGELRASDPDAEGDQSAEDEQVSNEV